MSDKTIPDNDTAIPLIDRRYRSLSKLGEGGFGSVYLVEDSWFGNRRLALKVLLKQHQEDADFERRFRDEIDVLRSLRHPAISEIINDGRTAAGEYYFTMEFVEGVALDQLMRAEAPFEPARVLRFIHQLLDVLTAAEEKRVVHRDLKPKNIMVEEPGTPNERLKILDFGIAKVMRPKSDSFPGAQMTQGVLGTPDYLAPEQIRGQDLDSRTDLYAAGIIFHQMLSGEFPFEGATSEARMAARLVSPPRALSAKVPAELRTLVQVLLEVDRDKRPTPVEARKLIEQETRSKKPFVLAGAGVVGLAAIAAVVWMLMGRNGGTSSVLEVAVDSSGVGMNPAERFTPPTISKEEEVPPAQGEPEPSPGKTAGQDVKPADDGAKPATPIVKLPEKSTAPPPAPVMKPFSVSTYPGYAEVYVDGETQNSNEFGRFDKSLSVGEHRFRVVADGQEFTLTYTVRQEDINNKLVIDTEQRVVRTPSR